MQIRVRRRKLSPVQLWLCVFLPVYLLGFGSKGLSAISGFKTVLFYVSCGLLIPAAGAELFLEAGRRRRAGEKPFRPRMPRPASLAALAFLFFTLLSALLSPYGGRVWYDPDIHEGAVTVSCYVLIFLCLSRWAMPTRTVFWCFWAGAAGFCLICLLQLFGSNPFGLYPAGLRFDDERVNRFFIGTMGNVDLVSAFLCLTVPILTLTGIRRRGGIRLCAWVLALVCLAILVCIRVLCGPVGLAAGAWICALVLLPVKKRTRRLLVLLTAVLALDVLALLWIWDPPVRFFHELHEILHGRADDTFGTGRFFIWRQMLERVPDRLILGVGPDGARLMGLEPFRRFDEAGNLVKTAAITDAHCLPLQILCCQGLPALLSWLALVGLSLAGWVRRRQDPAAAALGAGLVCFLIAMLFCFSSVILMPFLWVALGLLNSGPPRKTP